MVVAGNLIIRARKGSFIITTPTEMYYIPITSNLHVDSNANALVCARASSVFDKHYPFDIEGGVRAQDVFDQIVALKARPERPPWIFGGAVTTLIVAGIIAFTGNLPMSGNPPAPSASRHRTAATAGFNNAPTRLTGIPKMKPSAPATPAAADGQKPTKMRVISGIDALPGSFAVQKVPG